MTWAEDPPLNRTRVTGTGVDCQVTTACTVWWVDLRDDPRLLRVLSSNERERAASLTRWMDRQRFIMARALLRTILAERFLEPAASFVIETTCRVCGSTEHGRPELPQLGLSFSISHSGEKVGVAVAESGTSVGPGRSTIGLDIESMMNASQPGKCEIAEVALTSAEHRIWKALPKECQEDAALTWWTRKESVLKATGWGLAIPPGLFELTPPCERPSITRWAPEAVRFLGGVLPEVHLYDVRPGRNCVGALASLGAPLRVTQQAGDELLSRAAA